VTNIHKIGNKNKYLKEEHGLQVRDDMKFDTWERRFGGTCCLLLSFVDEESRFL
jgi:hypothetical protein